ncbi:hypothetical protein EJ05DRAFT_214240 [Pseudovirgaria hyperparasitica]|uniref:Phenol 2-monooxygenase n=1 Tax=Pseudovirgaria hyperparasitica TaxID=470096 RepID=A0A6A6VU45_9PEZI|nr:uncharacterized protein EJ05DRAFT_214240 [Pseudovirgaria hyperparasitica]KAF2753419.1 hypothetical protein EJ05DRAFT_214240 [Pseudovirgaria hyperparasitica]
MSWAMEIETPTYTDLVVIGAGPAGLMAACWAARYHVNVRILDDKPERVLTGHADGLTCRTLEIFDSFGIAHEVCSEASVDVQMRYWRPNGVGGLERFQSLISQKPGVSRFQQCLLSQGRIEELLERVCAEGGVLVERNMETLELGPIEEDESCKYPIEVKIRRKVNPGTPSEQEPAVDANDSIDDHGIKVIRCKYLIGADGAHSWTRRQLGIAATGASTDECWGVIDLVPLTNFPDIRQSCVISSLHGNIHVVPRERQLVRLYIQLESATPGERLDRSKITAEMLISTTKKILHPYTFEYASIDWFTVYQVGQRIADKFSAAERVFLVGDAVHTHSPKIGQGMNVSLQDAYNLSWKICSVIKGILKSSSLASYETERRPVAEELIDVDRETVSFYCSRGAIDRGGLQEFRNKHYRFLSGVAVDYSGSEMISPKHVSLPRFDDEPSTEACESLVEERFSHICLGQRLPSYRVVKHANAEPTSVGSLLSSNGRWKLLIFTGDLRVEAQAVRFNNVSKAISATSCSIRQRSALDMGCQASVDIFAIMACPRDSVPLLSLPEIYHPWNESTGWEYDTVYTDEPDVYGVCEDAYGRYGIDRTRGCLVLCRPDQHVAYCGELEHTAGLELFCSRIFMETRSECD